MRAVRLGRPGQRIFLPADVRGQRAARVEPAPLRPQGPRRMPFAQDVAGTAEQILDQLSADPVLAQVSELRLELPYEFNRGEYKQILHDASHLIVPELSWQPVSDAPLSAPPGIAGG
jgi:hypothetical protein